MSQPITITNEEILKQVKLSCKIPEIVEQIVTRKMIIAAAEEADIKVETEELQKAADFYRLINKLDNAEETWKWLERHSLSLDDFEEMIYNSVLSGKLTQHLFTNKIERFFFEHQLDYVGVVIYEVVLDDEDLALELFYAIREGEMSFYDVAHKYIRDTELRRKGGYLGIVRRQDLKPEISAAVFAATAPQFLKPIVSSIGIHLILVEEIIQPQLDEQLRQKIALDMFSEWLKEQTDNIQFNIDLDTK
jgi:PPIC-type PPIASE domain